MTAPSTAPDRERPASGSSRAVAARRVAPAVAVLGIVLVAALGAGFGAARVTFPSAAAWLRHGDRVQHVDPSGGSTQTITVGTDTFEIVPNPTSGLVVRNDGADPSFIAYGPDGQESGRAPAGDGVELLLGDGSGLRMDRTAGTVTRLDDQLRPTADVIELGAPVVSSTLDASGTAWLLDEQGRVHRVGADGSHEVVGEASRDERLVSLDDQLWILTTDGNLRELDGARSIAAGPAVTGPTVQVGQHHDGPLLPVVKEADGTRTLTVIDTGRQVAGTIALPAASSTDAPVVAGERVAVPAVVDGRNVLLLFEWTPDGLRTAGDPVDVSAHRGPADQGTGIDVFVRVGRIWANDPDRDVAITVTSTGQVTEVAKLPPKAPDDLPTTTTTPLDDEVLDPTPDEPELTDPLPDPAPDPVLDPVPPTFEPAPPSAAVDPIPPLPDPRPVVTSPPTTAPTTTAPPPSSTAPPTATTLTVPNLVGRPAADACDGLRLRCTIVVDQSTIETPTTADRVLRHTPPAGTVVAEDSTVTLTVPRPRRDVALPAVSGATYDAACASITGAGLTCGPQVDAGPTPDAARVGTVDRASVGGSPVAEGTPLAEGTEVTLAVFTSQTQVAVPPAPIGAGYDAACATLVQAGLACAGQQPVVDNISGQPMGPGGTLGYTSTGSVPAGTPVGIQIWSPPLVTIHMLSGVKDFPDDRNVTVYVLARAGATRSGYPTDHGPLMRLVQDQGGACPAGTEGVWGWMKQEGSAFHHFYVNESQSAWPQRYGYERTDILGCGWTAQVPGTTPVFAFRNDSTGKDRLYSLTGVAPGGYTANPRETLYYALAP